MMDTNITSAAAHCQAYLSRCPLLTPSQQGRSASTASAPLSPAAALHTHMQDVQQQRQSPNHIETTTAAISGMACNWSCSLSMRAAHTAAYVLVQLFNRWKQWMQFT
jgi:predicted metal-binding protein